MDTNNVRCIVIFTWNIRPIHRWLLPSSHFLQCFKWHVSDRSLRSINQMTTWLLNDFQIGWSSYCLTVRRGDWYENYIIILWFSMFTKKFIYLPSNPPEFSLDDRRGTCAWQGTWNPDWTTIIIGKKLVNWFIWYCQVKY